MSAAVQAVDAIHGIARGARRLREIPGAGFVPGQNCVPGLDPVLTGRWLDLAAAGDTDAFAAYLRRDARSFEANDRLPEWIGTILSICEAARAGVSTLEPTGREPVPFEKVLVPAVHVASIRLDKKAPTSAGLLAPSARLALERTLLKRISLHAAPLLARELDAAREPGARMALRWLSFPQSACSTALYRQYVSKVLEDGLTGLFRRAPVLARAMATMVDAWVDASAEFLERLDRDIGDIRVNFGAAGSCETGIISLEGGLSDPHHGGRTVMLLSFEDGSGFVYKPRDVTAEAAFYDFIQWCNAQGSPIDLAAPRVLCRNGYGWVERVTPQPLPDAQAASRYYRRAGALLAALHLLHGTDAHHENVIASGEYPVFIDAETLLTPDFVPGSVCETRPGGSPAARRLARSVLRTGMLPCRIGGTGAGLAYDVSPLGDAEGEMPLIPRWQNVNTDAMHQVLEPARLTAAYLPMLDGRPVCARDYSREVVAGFTEMSRWLVDRKSALLAGDGPLSAFSRIVTRVIVRPTAVYGVILHRSLRPELLASGVKRSIELEILARMFVGSREQPKTLPLLEVERESLENLDVPWFSVRATATALNPGPGRAEIADFFPRSGFDELMDRVSRLATNDVEEEAAIIQGAFAAATTIAVEPVSEISRMVKATASTNALVAAAEDIAQNLARHAVRDGNGAADWCTLALTDDAGHFALQPAGPSLYEGVSGTALFFASLDAVRGTSEYRDLVLGAMETACHEVEREASLPLGGAIGLGSVIYAFVRVAGLTGVRGLVETARRIATRITLERIAADVELDVLTGAAGAILGLLALFDSTRDSGILAMAEDAGRRLVACATPTSAGPRAWRSNSPEPLAGMSHGAAGIAYALLRLSGTTGKTCHLHAAAEGIAYERSLFSPENDNWKDLRSPTSEHNGQRTSWCHGAPGIGLARLGGLPYLGGSEIRCDIDAAIRTTRAACFGPIDHLCCGVFGRIETLLVASTMLGRPELRAEGLEHAAHALARGLHMGHNATPFAPGFFRGMAGIGYQLLRLADPNSLPSVLLWG